MWNKWVSPLVLGVLSVATIGCLQVLETPFAAFLLAMLGVALTAFIFCAFVALVPIQWVERNVYARFRLWYFKNRQYRIRKCVADYPDALPVFYVEKRDHFILGWGVWEIMKHHVSSEDYARQKTREWLGDVDAEIISAEIELAKKSCAIIETFKPGEPKSSKENV
ncbi:hypothetical protein E4H12_05295 [Candidatus Thorarchaeota archaeon]|nr:MAG: hypothetical protein E4H12_05295 [Candidatus Thorarchaeota archaeon]